MKTRALSVVNESEPQNRDWRWQLKNATRTLAQLERELELTPGERRAVARLSGRGGLPLAITPHYLSLMDPRDKEDPLRRQLVPSELEDEDEGWDRRDPLGEEEHEAVPHLVHRYPDRVLLLATDRCASYCRFCTRKRLVGQGPTARLAELDAALLYVAKHPELKEVIVSGGDALMLDDERLARLLAKIRDIEHVEIVRLATRMLAFAPQRVGDGLLRVIAQHHPVYILSHFNHPRELLGEAALAVERLANAGVPVLNQTVLLKGINDDAETLASLFRHLTRLRARPYYLHQCDLAPGTHRFRVPLERASALMGELRGQVSGLSLPTLVIDTPGGNGKVPIYPSPMVSEDDDSVLLRGSLGGLARYPKR
jgi:lysine 2,3-aminomutase